MKRLNLGFGRYSDSNLLVAAQAILVSMSGNSYFPTPTPSLATVTTAIDDYSAALSSAKEGGKTNVATKNAKREELINLLVQLGNYVSFTAAGDLVVLVSSGIPVQRDREPHPPLETPIISKVEDGVNSGELRVTIKRVKGARNYVYQYSPDPLADDSEWISQNSTLTKLTVSGLELGKRYWFRVIAYGNNEQEVISDPMLSRIVQ